jgi:hypothetical protein
MRRLMLVNGTKDPSPNAIQVGFMCLIFFCFRSELAFQCRIRFPPELRLPEGRVCGALELRHRDMFGVLSQDTALMYVKFKGVSSGSDTGAI